MFWALPQSAQPNESQPAPSVPRIVAPANPDDVMWEQLAYLMDHGACNPATCPECYRYGQVRAILLLMFGEGK